MTGPGTSTAMMADEFQALRPSGGFRVVLADPPWEHLTFSEKGQGKSPSQHYDTMTDVEIAAMPVELLAAEDCALFIWCTWPKMAIWNQVIIDWGFTFSGLAWEWVKFNTETGKYAFGGGYGTRKNLEPCLLATRGNPSLRQEAEFFGNIVIPDGVRSVRDFIEAMPTDCIRAERREHSRKPDEQYKRIQTLFDGPYIELFSRITMPGWSVWGNETKKFGDAA